MLRDAISLLTIVAVMASMAWADPGRSARIVTRDSVVNQGGVTSRVISNAPNTAGMLTFQGRAAAAGAAINQRRLPQVSVIERPVVEPAAVVSRELSEQPVHPHLIEVFLLGEGQRYSSTIYLDPEVDYANQGELELDENHSINRAQRLANSLRTRRDRPSRVIRRPDSLPGPVIRLIKPAFILRKHQTNPVTPAPGPSDQPRTRPQLVSSE